LIPGVLLITTNEDIETSYFPMDLPNLIELWRVNYAMGHDSRPVEVLWKAESFREESRGKRNLIEAQGWEILNEEEAERLQIIRNDPREYKPYPTMMFTLRRKELFGPLIPADPTPCSWRTGPDP
jgi:hypothetical protein